MLEMSAGSTSAFHGVFKMNQNAKRNLHRRKKLANRLSKRDYFRQKKEAALIAPVAELAKVA